MGGDAAPGGGGGGAALSCAYMPLSFFLSLPLEPGFRQAILDGEAFYSHEHTRAIGTCFARWTRSPVDVNSSRTCHIRRRFRPPLGVVSLRRAARQIRNQRP